MFDLDQVRERSSVTRTCVTSSAPSSCLLFIYLFVCVYLSVPVPLLLPLGAPVKQGLSCSESLVNRLVSLGLHRSSSRSACSCTMRV
ncbi:unnamed protein product [Pleuronectes platessa]|uniref:Uncharacterized protein n=1 Tax=Pleuronectes platessa TaxID=8262 RepID=A0A9N7TZ67_PLEPL|nr:unnamed protein product [Pleuronectes platessa]